MTGKISRRRIMPSREVLAEMLEYRDGVFFWLNRPRSHFTSDRNMSVWNGTWAGKRAGQMTTCGRYRMISINKVRYLEHRLVYHFLRGPLETFFEVDHIDGNGLNNKIENLRACSHLQNSHNSKSRRPHMPKNVYWSKLEGKYKVHMRCNWKMHHIGTFENLEDAKKAAESARIRLHGEFSNA